MEKKEAKVIDWARLTQEMERLLRLKTSPVAYKRLEKIEELEKIPGVIRLNRRASFCHSFLKIGEHVKKLTFIRDFSRQLPRLLMLSTI